jgi:hypothetical protein
MSRVVAGDFEISLIRESVYWWDGGAFFGVVPKTLWSRRIQADESNRIPAALNCYLVRTPGHTILIETGSGDKMDARARERMRMPPVPEPLPAVIERHTVDTTADGASRVPDNPATKSLRSDRDARRRAISRTPAGPH